MIRLIFGCSGSGKTATIVNRIKESVINKKRTYLLVPEQQVFTAESMLADLPSESALYFEVISFSRLCDMVFDRYGGRNHTSVSKGAKHLIMWNTVKEMSGAFSEYGKTMTDAKFASLMLATLDELKANSISPERLDEISEGIEQADLSGKLSDISLVISAYNKNLSDTLGESATLSENKLERLSECLMRNNFFAGTNVFIDSFTDFTGIEHEVISRIMKQADDLYISVYSKARGYRAQHTQSAVETIKRLTRDCRESGQPFEDITLNGNTRTHSLQLKLLETHLWDFTAKKDTLPEIPKEQSHDIEMVKCLNEYEETECIALKILKAKQEGMRYSEMTLILRNPEDRSGIINAVFSKYNIPYFLSEKTGLSNTPSARFLLSSLRCVSRNYRYDDVMTLLKTGLCGVDPSDADLFEEYCRTWNIQGKIFTENAWSMNPAGFKTELGDRENMILASANKVRRHIIEPLEALKIKLHAANGNTVQMCRALFEYTEQHKMCENLSALAELELSLGNTKDAGEILRTYDFLLSSLSEICVILKNSRLTAEELYTAIEIMLSSTDIASVPSMGEYVTIGSAATLRVENIKLAIVSELCEGIFPALPKESGLIGEGDKERLEDSGLTFKTRKDRLMSDELFYVYRAISKPSDKLILTTYTSSISGSARVPSTPWRRLTTLFDLPIEEFDMKAVRSLVSAKKAQADADNMYAHIRDIFGEADVCEEHISPETVRAVFGDTLSLSKSKIQNFVKCPMLFWSSNILDLRQSSEASIGASETGNLVHFVLENLFCEITLPDGSVAKKTQKEILALTDKWVNEYIDLMRCPRTPAFMFAFSKIRNMAYLMAQNICEEFSASSFKMHSFEQRISLGRNSLEPLKITLDEIEHSPVVCLGGSADRIDTYTSEDGKTYIRIIDYKTGKISFDEESVKSGADIQLPAYLFAVASEENAREFSQSGIILPGASLYVSAVESRGDISICRSGMIYNSDEFICATNKDRNLKFVSSALAAKEKNAERELFDDERMAQMKQLLTDTIKNTGNQIFSGVIKRTPSPQSCRFCPVRSTCPVADHSKY